MDPEARVGLKPLERMGPAVQLRDLEGPRANDQVAEADRYSLD